MALQLKDFLPYRLSVLSNRVSQQIAGYYHDRFGLTIPQWRVMAVLAETPRLSATEVAERTAMDKAAVSRAVKSLTDRGYLKRHASQTDGRFAHLTLTAKGRKVYDEVIPVALDYEKKLLDTLTPSERKTLDEVLEKLAGTLPE